MFILETEKILSKKKCKLFKWTNGKGKSCCPPISPQPQPPPKDKAESYE